MAYSTTQIIQWAKISQPLSAIGEAKQKANTEGNTVNDLHMKLYVERKTFEFQYTNDPTDTQGYLFGMGQYVLALIGEYLFPAQDATGGGVSIIPGTSVSQAYPIYITDINFSTATLYPNTNIFGTEIIIFLNEINRYLIPNSEFTVDSTGVTITLAGFDATLNTYNLVIQKVF